MFTCKALAIILLVSSSSTFSMQNEKNNEQPNPFLQGSQAIPVPSIIYPSLPVPPVTLSIPLPILPNELPKRSLWAGGAIANIGIADHATRFTISTLAHANGCIEHRYAPSTYLLAAAGAGLAGASAGSVLLCAKKAYCGQQAIIKKKKAALGIGKVASGAIIFALSTQLTSLDDSMATTTLARGGQFISLACAADGIYDIYTSVGK